MGVLKVISMNVNNGELIRSKRIYLAIARELN